MVALAILMPIVASMGGNAGTQTMTVAVRALATRELGRANAWRIIRREAAVGLLNGLVFAVILGTWPACGSNPRSSASSSALRSSRSWSSRRSAESSCP